MATRVIRAALAALAAVSLVLGVWASFAPRSFYEDFPGGGHTWVADDGPYNEHLVRDFGALNLAITVVTVFALVALGRALVTAVALAWIVYQAPHLVYHARHLDVYTSGFDKVGTVLALALSLVLPVVVLVYARRLRPG
jgi:hypothetical protein